MVVDTGVEHECPDILGLRGADRLGRVVVQRRPGPAEVDPTGFGRRRRRLELALGWVIPIAVVAGWELTSRTGALDPDVWPPPSEIWSAGVELVGDGDLLGHMTSSYRRIAYGFLLGSVAGILVGIAMGMSRLLRVALEPIIYALWMVPKLALLPLLLLVFGIGEAPIVLLLAIACFFIVLIPMVAAMINVPAGYQEAALAFQASRLQLLRHVLLPDALPHIFVALRLAAGVAILVLVAAEFVQVNSGLGYLIWHSWSLFLPQRMYVGILVVSISGTLFMLFIGAVGRWLMPWQSTS